MFNNRINKKVFILKSDLTFYLLVRIYLMQITVVDQKLLSLSRKVQEIITCRALYISQSFPPIRIVIDVIAR